MSVFVSHALQRYSFLAQETGWPHGALLIARSREQRWEMPRSRPISAHDAMREFVNNLRPAPETAGRVNHPSLPRAAPDHAARSPVELLIRFAQELAGSTAAVLRHDATADDEEVVMQVCDATAVSEHGFEDDAIAVSEENAPSGQHRRSNRHLRTKPERLVIGEEVIRWKEANAATDRHWLRTYTMQHFHVSDTEGLKRLSNYACKCGIAFTRSLTEVGKESGWIGRGNREDGHRCQRVPWKRRLRAPGAGRPEKCPEVSAELFQYWVDRAETLKARVPSADLYAHAAVLLSLMKEAYDLAVAEGREPGGACPPRIHRVRLAPPMAQAMGTDLADRDTRVQSVVGESGTPARRAMGEQHLHAMCTRGVVRCRTVAIRGPRRKTFLVQCTPQNQGLGTPRSARCSNQRSGWKAPRAVVGNVGMRVMGLGERRTAYARLLAAETWRSSQRMSVQRCQR